MATINDLVRSFAFWCARKEGYFDNKKRPTLPQMHNNPLDLRRWKNPAGVPYPENNGFVEFPRCERPGCKDPDHPSEVGWRAGRGQSKINIVKRGLTFLEFFSGKRGVYDGFANARDGNDPAEYARYVCEGVCRDLGVDARCSDPRCSCREETNPRCVKTVILTLVTPTEKNR